MGKGYSPPLQAPLTDVSRPDSIPGTLASVNQPMAELVPRLAGLTTASTLLLQHVQQEGQHSAARRGKPWKASMPPSKTTTWLQRLINELNTTLIEARRTLDASRQLLDASKGMWPVWRRARRGYSRIFKGPPRPSRPRRSSCSPASITCGAERPQYLCHDRKPARHHGES